MQMLIKNGTLVTPEKTWQADILIVEEKIAKVGTELNSKAEKVIDASGKLVLPGVIDAHTHMGIPIKDTWSADDFASGTHAAACGGVTTVMDFTVQAKGQTLLESIEERMRRADGQSLVDYTLHCNITDFTPSTVEDMQQVVAQGLTSFKVFMAYKRAGMMLQDHELIRVFAKAAELGAIVMLHAENGDIIDFLTDRLIEEGKVAARYHATSRPVQAEIEAVNRAITLAEITGATLYVVHLTSGAALALIHQARQRGLPIIAETCPQYLLFTQDAYQRPDDGHCYIASPPFRQAEDCESLWQGIKNQWISVVGTDHCPFTRAQKDSGNRHFHTTPNGLPGVETLLPLLYSEGVRKNRITINQMVQVLSENPAKIFGLFPRKGRLQEGADADVVIFNPDQKVRLGAKMLHSQTDWSPYEGWEIVGYPERTILRGHEVMRNGELVQAGARGQFLSATPSSISLP